MCQNLTSNYGCTQKGAVKARANEDFKLVALFALLFVTTNALIGPLGLLQHNLVKNDINEKALRIHYHGISIKKERQHSN